MIKNYYYLIVGILAILFSITHAWNGQTVVLPSLNVPGITADTKTISFLCLAYYHIRNYALWFRFYFYVI